MVEHYHLPDIEESNKRLLYWNAKCMSRNSLISCCEIFSCKMTGADEAIYKSTGGPETLHEAIRSFKMKVVWPGSVTL